MITQCPAQSFMQQMGCGMICTNTRTAFRRDYELSGLPHSNKAFRDFGHVNEQIRSFAAIGDLKNAALGHDLSTVTDLTAAFRIERRLVEYNLHNSARVSTVHLPAILHERHDLTFSLFGVIAQKICRAMVVQHVKPNRIIGHFTRACPSSTGFGFLSGHRAVKAIRIDREAFLTQSILRQVKWEAESVIELKGGGARQGAALRQIANLIFQQAQTPVQSGAETGFFLQQSFFNHRLGLNQFRIGRPHLLDQSRHQAMHQWIRRADQMRMTHCTAHDPPQHIATPILGG